MGRSNSTIIRTILLLGVIIIGMSAISTAATIKGIVYDLGLTQESDVILEINTVPKQIMIAKDGSYAFNVPYGNYTLNAKSDSGSATEQIMITTEGEYSLDIILEPIIETPTPLDTTLDEEYTPTITPSMWIGLILLSILIIMVLVMLTIRLNKQKRVIAHDKPHNGATSENSNEEYYTQALTFIRKEQRTTQKELRKHLPLSEGKISLIVTELEHDGKIRKIKKGRGNILIFVKD